jgi:hypothetical protein
MRWIVLAAVLVAAAILGVGLFMPTAREPVGAGPSFASGLPAEPLPASMAPGYSAPRVENCADVPRFAEAAARNAVDIDALVFAPFRRPETGWRVYAPHIAVEIGSTCAYGSSGFANALAGWQQANRLPPTGVLDIATFEVMRVRWHLKRPFVILNRAIGCPPGPPQGALAVAVPREVYGGEPIQARADALAALRRMVADARAQDPAIARDRQALLIISAYRSPEENDVRCLIPGSCDNVSRAPCSAHRTGLAFDLVVGAAPGGRVDSTENFNRLAQSQTPAYRWMVRNAHRYGFVNYVFEPWHWEWSPPEQRGATRA